MEQMQSAEPAPQPPGEPATAAKAPRRGAPLSVGERHWLPVGAGGFGTQPATLPHPDQEPRHLHSGLPRTVRQTDQWRDK